MLNLHLTAIASVASAGTLGGVVWLLTKTGKLVNFIETHVEKAKTAWNKIDAILAHLKANQPAAEAVQDAQQATDTIDPALRDALLNKAVREALAAFKIEAGTLGETYRDGIIQYATSTVPDVVKPLVPQLLDATLQAIQNGNAAALNHPAIQAVKTLKSTPIPTAQVQEVESTVSTQTVSATMPVAVV